MISTSLLITLVLAVTEALAVSCDLSNVSLSPQDNRTLSSIVLGVGFQYYNCSTTGKYTSAGAKALLLDYSCIIKDPQSANIPEIVFNIWNGTNSTNLALPPILAKFSMGNHYYQNYSNVYSPIWDFRTGIAQEDRGAFMVGSKIAEFPSPSGPKNVAWVELKRVLGELAEQVYRTNTVGGSPPDSCDPEYSSVQQVKYVAMYWLVNGTISWATDGTQVTFPTNFTFPTDVPSTTDVTYPTSVPSTSSLAY